MPVDDRPTYACRGYPVETVIELPSGEAWLLYIPGAGMGGREFTRAAMSKSKVNSIAAQHGIHDAERVVVRWARRGEVVLDPRSAKEQLKGAAA